MQNTVWSMTLDAQHNTSSDDRHIEGGVLCMAECINVFVYDCLFWIIHELEAERFRSPGTPIKKWTTTNHCQKTHVKPTHTSSKLRHAVLRELHVLYLFYRGGNLSLFRLMVNSRPGPHRRIAALIRACSSLTYLLLVVFSLFPILSDFVLCSSRMVQCVLHGICHPSFLAALLWLLSISLSLYFILTCCHFPDPSRFILLNYPLDGPGQYTHMSDSRLWTCNKCTSLSKHKRTTVIL